MKNKSTSAGEVIDNLHMPVVSLLETVERGVIANIVRGLPVDGDVIAAYWTPIKRARLAAGAPVPAGALWNGGK